jgi:hypothetical protein
LALWHLRGPEVTTRPPLIAGIAHGLLGATALAALLVALQGPPRGVESGAGQFGTVSAVLFAAALITGIALLLLHRKGLVMAIHAGIAITGYVLFLAWYLLG